MVQAISESELLSPRQFGELLGLPHKEVIRRINKGDIEASKLGGWNWVIEQSEVKRIKKSEWYQRIKK